MEKIIAYDLGTGGIKASLHTGAGECLAKSFFAYPTVYPRPGWHEQRPEDWWQGVCRSTRALLEETSTAPEEIRALALSGHSLVAAPLDKNGSLLLQSVPIWSDMRAQEQAKRFFSQVDYDEWYRTTGNGDPPACYSVFKLMWMKEHQPDIFARTAKVLGSKDYINYRLTGQMMTDYSYASGTGVFSLKDWDYVPAYLEAAGLSEKLLPQILPSHGIVGAVTAEAAAETGLHPGTLVACGGVDNTCMALGALGLREGACYISLGSSSWIAVNCREPVLDRATLPFTFAHAEKGCYTSAASIFAAGSAYTWARRELCRDLDDGRAMQEMDRLAQGVPIGAHGAMFNPSLAGGSAQEKSPLIRGGFAGLSLGTTREDLLRAVLEGVTMNLALLYDDLRRKTALGEEILLCGGGSKSALWRQMFADVFGKTIRKTNIDQDAASLGAAAIAARGSGLWDDYSPIEDLHHIQATHHPEPAAQAAYAQLRPAFCTLREMLADYGERYGMR